MNPTNRLFDVLAWASTREYAGYDYADGMSSAILRSIPIDARPLNLAIQELVKRSPVNVRPLAGVPPRRSFKGSALFIMANLVAYERSDDPSYLRDAIELASWLLQHRSTTPFGWGHNHRLQTLTGTIPRNTPSIVTVTFVTRALLQVQQYGFNPGIDLATEVERLILDTLDYEEVPDGARIDYRDKDTSAYTVLNANALGAALLTELASSCDRPDLLDLADPILNFVAARQHASGGWYYADPPDASHLSMDTHHNGFILESYLRHRALTGSDAYRHTIQKAVQFHEEQLFEPGGAPRWDERSTYPRDIHAAAQGIITFSHAGDLRFARQILDWTDRHMYHQSGRYLYRQSRWYRRRFTLMRWCQAWMAFAIATYLDCSDPGKQRISIVTSEPVG